MGILMNYKVFENYNNILYHVLDTKKFKYVMETNSIKSYLAGNGRISLTRDKMFNSYIGDSPLSILKLEIDGSRLKQKYRIKPFSYKANNGSRFDEREEQVQTNLIKPVFPYITKVILIKRNIDRLIKKRYSEDDVSDYITSVGTRNGTINDIVKEIKSLTESHGFELYVQDGSVITKNDEYIDSLINHPIEHIEIQYAPAKRGYMKIDGQKYGVKDTLVDIDGNIYNDFYIGMRLPSDFKTFGKEEMGKIETSVELEDSKDYILTLRKMKDSTWKLDDMRPL